MSPYVKQNDFGWSENYAIKEFIPSFKDFFEEVKRHKSEDKALRGFSYLFTSFVVLELVDFKVQKEDTNILLEGKQS